MKPRTAISASARTAFTPLVIRRLGGHSGTLAQASELSLGGPDWRVGLGAICEKLVEPPSVATEHQAPDEKKARSDDGHDTVTARPRDQQYDTADQSHRRADENDQGQDVEQVTHVPILGCGRAAIGRRSGVISEHWPSSASIRATC